MVKGRWSQSEVEFLKKNYARMNNIEISKALGRSIPAVRGAMIKFSLLRSRAIARKLQVHSFFKPGHVPANKGTRGFRITRRKNLEHCKEREIGAIKLVCYKKVRHGELKKFFYKKIKVLKNKWVMMHRHVYIQHHGSIPNGFTVGFKDGNSLNCDPGNLFLISMAEKIESIRDGEKISRGYKRAYESGRLFESNKWVAARMFKIDKEARALAVNNSQLMELKRLQFKVQKELQSAHNDRR